MARPYGQVVRPIRVPNIRGSREVTLAEAIVNKGMVTAYDPIDLDNGALQVARNAIVRLDKTSRRAGSTNIGVPEPDLNPVLKVITFKQKTDVKFTYRFNHSGVHLLTGGAWVAQTGTLTGSINDRITTAVVNDRLVFANNGADELQLMNTSASSFADLGAAVPKYRFVTGFFNRVIGAAIRGVDEAYIGWSADGVITEFDPLVNISAGGGPLIDSTDDATDFIKGIFGLNKYLVVLRERSLWLGTKQPVPTDPFYFASVFPGIGCDTPYSAQVIHGGVAFLDRAEGTVYAWAAMPNSPPEPIGRPIENRILANIDDENTIFSCYDPIQTEYHLCIPLVGSDITNVWTYNLKTKAWAQNEYFALTSMDMPLASDGYVTIDALGDTAIENLVGNIEDLTPIQNVVKVKYFGKNDGRIAKEDIASDLDGSHEDYPDGIEFETELVSKLFRLDSTDLYVSKLTINYKSVRSGSITIQYTTNGVTWKTAKTITIDDTPKNKKIIVKRLIKATEFAWRVTSTKGAFDLLGYEVKVSRAGESTQNG